MAAVQEVLHGIVLLAAPVGEMDRRVVLLTQERGRICAFARGARRPNSPLLARSQSFAMGEFTVCPGRDAYTLVQADIREYFDGIGRDFEAMCYGSYFCEFINWFARENLEAPDLLNLLYLSLSMLVKKRFSYPFLRSVFELKVLALEGEAPWMESCLICKEDARELGFYFSRGGVLCEECAKKAGKKRNEDYLPVSPSVRYAAAYIIAVPLYKLYSFQLRDQAEGELIQFVKAYTQRMVSHTFKSLQLIE